MKQAPSDLVELIYDAALDETRWRDFLGQAAGAFHSGPAVLSLHDFHGHATQVNVSAGVEATSGCQSPFHDLVCQAFSATG